ncbi:MAG: trypsin-like peptidase domain-containing protein, partial [Candidatus Niyogibacteria bacterium]|nr:trypsin-like peptidase domain-containing protein [Candidatus Niyogibacteria bacterium]
VTSVVTGIVTITLVDQAPSPLRETIHKVVEQVKVNPNEEDEGKAVTTEQFIVLTQEDLVIKIVRESNPAVVSVIATKDVPILEQVYIDPFGNDPFFDQFVPPEFRKIPQLQQKGTERRDISSGSGFFVSRDGMLVTNRHVVEDTGAEYVIVTNNGSRIPADVLARDPVQDLAVLKADVSNMAFLSLGDSDSLQIGQSVVAIGNALGEFQNTVSVGVISGLGRNITAIGSSSGPETLSEVIQTDAAINPGNSGGPLLDLSGRVIGINSAVAKNAENIGFALPVNFVKKDIADVKQFGEIRYAFLGIRYITITAQVKEEKALPVSYGALVAKGPNGEPALIEGSPAALAGVLEGDIVIEVDGVKISADKPLGSIIGRHSVGDVIRLKILRNGGELFLEAKLAERPDSL